MSVSFLKHYYNFLTTFSIILRLISGTDTIGSIVIFNISGPEVFVRLALR